MCRVWLFLGILLYGPAAPHRSWVFRFVDCVHQRTCPGVSDEELSQWSTKHESLYWSAVEEIARKEACTDRLLKGKMAFQSEERLTLFCKNGTVPIPWLGEKETAEKALLLKGVKHLEVFKKSRALKTDQGIGVEISSDSYVKVGEVLRDEGSDTYDVVESNGRVEIRLVFEIAI